MAYKYNTLNQIFLYYFYRFISILCIYIIIITQILGQLYLLKITNIILCNTLVYTTVPGLYTYEQFICSQSGCVPTSIELKYINALLNGFNIVYNGVTMEYNSSTYLYPLNSCIYIIDYINYNSNSPISKQSTITITKTGSIITIYISITLSTINPIIQGSTTTLVLISTVTKLGALKTAAVFTEKKQATLLVVQVFIFILTT